MTCIIPSERDRWHSKNIEDWIIRSEASYFENNLKLLIYSIIMELGDIYCLTSPSGKKYIGQAVKKLKSGKNWGYINRWKEHIRDSKTRDYCRLLNNSIRKYGYENFKVELLKECLVEELNKYEQEYIVELNTLSPNGYNLTSGGNFCQQTEETQILKRNSMIGKNKGKTYPKRIRKNSEDNELPKYVRHYTDNSGKEGYRVSNHPTLKQKSFLKKSLTMNEKLQLALKYINAETAEIS
jgi:group I intron endonuclease